MGWKNAGDETMDIVAPTTSDPAQLETPKVECKANGEVLEGSHTFNFGKTVVTCEASKTSEDIANSKCEYAVEINGVKIGDEVL